VNAARYVVRMGKKRGRGQYLTRSTVVVFNVGFFHYTRKQSRAYRFDAAQDALEAARGCSHVEEYRVVRLVTLGEVESRRR